MHLGALNLWTKPEELELFASRVAAKDAPLENCVSFIDGTMRVTCRPSKNQKAAYSGYKSSQTEIPVDHATEWDHW